MKDKIWSRWSKWTFRLVCSYFLLYIFLMFFSGLFETPFRWIGLEVLGISYEYDRSGFGSGDNTYAYITCFVNVVLAFFCFILWSLIDRKRPNYNTFYYWFKVVLRLFLIIFMFTYGFVKVFQIQFQSPSLIRLLQPIGEMSPMGLAWTYMGYSKGFGAFAGLMEIIGGILLIPRRTIALGSFIIMGVMTQVAMMNLFFDIPVKLFSIHLVLMAVVLFASDSKRFWYAFVRNSTTEIEPSYHPVKEKDYHYILFWVKLVGFIFVFSFALIFGYNTEKKRSPNNKANISEFYGIWETKRFIKNGDTILPLITNKEYWRYLILERKRRSVVKTMANQLERYYFNVDTATHKISMYSPEGDKDSLNISYEYDMKTLRLKGLLEDDSIEVLLTLKNLNNFPLKSRGFRWINERPYNR
ncbi:hypothetical protein J4050_02705 [Winogradskyella sp. DF17]|uniref:DoxX-like family protein n=1 Tax=Winogradskyella pelagia TaxID=2819984 RepID=A0ABS3SYV0_9FLAO|nr:DoxX family protein [Winogradskyella sp. DF17]MBO3115638.1 hypothetical protein [Winogradskyella sp. DF17]